MSLKRTTAFLIALGMALGWAGPVSADIGDMQLFAPVRLNSFGGGRTAATGPFFKFDALMWYVQQPDRALIGATGNSFIFSNRIDFPVPDQFPPEFVPPYTTPDPGVDPVPYFDLVGFNQHSTADTAGLTQAAQFGQRYELGWMGDHAGLMVSGFYVNRRSEALHLGRGSILFEDPGAPDPLLSGVIFGTYVYGYVPLVLDGDGNPNDDWGNTLTIDRPIDIFYGTLFEDLKATYKLRDFWSIELDYLRRTNQLHRGGYLELFLGARYLEFDDQFIIEGSNPETTAATEAAMKDYTLLTDAENHIFGLQLGLRYFKQHQQWMFNVEGRFMAGLNNQNVHQQSSFNSNDVLYWPGWKSAQSAFFQEFTPLVELRLELAYQATDAIKAKVGWTGIWMDGLVRSPSVPQYMIPDTGILNTANRQDMLTHGLTLGIEVNR